jgi:hypothetical protein
VLTEDVVEQPDVLQSIAVQHDHIGVSPGRKGLELALGVQRPATTHGAPRSSASAPRCSRPIGMGRPWFMLSRPALVGRSPTLGVPAPGGRCHAEA